MTTEQFIEMQCFFDWAKIERFRDAIDTANLPTFIKEMTNEIITRMDEAENYIGTIETNNQEIISNYYELIKLGQEYKILKPTITKWLDTVGKLLDHNQDVVDYLEKQLNKERRKNEQSETN